MKKVIAAKTHTLLSLEHQELVALNNCVNELLNNSSLTSDDCEARIGMKIDTLRELGATLSATVDAAGSDEFERFDAWRDGASIQIIAISATGDPADRSDDSVRQTIPALDSE